jgi:hypothetical protein
VAAPQNPLPPDVREAIDRGDALAAIKLLRKRTGAGLKDAKDVIERSLQRERVPPPSAAPPQRLGRPGPRLSPGEVPRSAGLGRWLLVAAIVAAVVYFVWVRSPGVG